MKHVIIFAKLEYMNIRDNVSKLLISLTNSKINLSKEIQSLMPFFLLIFISNAVVVTRIEDK